MVDPLPSAPEPDIEPSRSRLSASLIWLVPGITFIILLTVMWQTYGDRGPLVTIVFDRGTGMEAGKTPVRYRGIEIGVVESVGLSETTEQVIVRARMDKTVARHMNASASFWLVRPRVSGSQVSGLDTLLGGAYIGASWASSDGGASRREFVGLDSPPLTPAGTPGRHVRLHATDGAIIAVGAPVYFKGVNVGRIETRGIKDDSSGVTYSAFIDAPYDARVSGATRFWNVSGFTVELGSEGAQLHVESLLTLLEGGVAFDNLPVPPGVKVVGGEEDFTLYSDPDEAMASLLETPPDRALLLTAVFAGSVRGLKPGAPVQYRGVQVGEVRQIEVDLTPDNDDVAISTVLEIQPLRLSRGDIKREQLLQGFQKRIERGLRAQLASGNLLTGALYVNLVDRPHDTPLSLDMTATPYPRIPTVPSNIAAITSSAQSFMARIEALPLEQSLAALTRVLDDAHVMLSSQQTQELPENINKAAAGIAELANGQSTRDAARDLARTLSEAHALVARLNQLDLGTRVSNTLQSAERSAAALEKASKSLPVLMRSLTSAAGDAQTMLKGLTPGSAIHYELQRALSEVRRAAKSVAELAKQLDAKPNAIILGK